MTLTCEMFLFMASRAQLVEEIIRPALAAGHIVISDRYLLANVVYQGHAGGLDPDQLWTIGQTATGGLSPDLTLVLDLPVEVGLKRAAARAGAETRFERFGIDFHQRVRDGFVVPERAVAAALEPRPDLLAVFQIIANDRAHVVQLVGCRHEADRRARAFEMREVVFLSLLPRQLVFGIFDEAVAAAKDDVGDHIAEAGANLRQRRFPAAVFGGVVQQGRDRLIFVGAVFHGDRRHAEHVRDVGNAGALAALAVMHLPGIGHRGGKPIGRRQRHSPMVA